MLPEFERFSPPLLSKNIIRRQTVNQQINDMAERSILFVHAPAGYGKTTVVALWARDKDTVWLSLDEFSASPKDIYRWLLFALSCEAPRGFDASPLECALDALQKVEKWPQAIIIDDFHLSSDPSMARGLLLIRSRMPISTSFIILSRNPPPDILHEHIIKGKIKQITNLQFSYEEIILLFNKNNLPISKYDAELLRRQTRGWAAALAAVLISHTSRFSDVLNCKTLHNYLKSYVFDYWDDLDILKKCSVCETLNPKLCETITGQAGSWGIIKSLADRTGLVSRFDDGTYRFHELLNDFLFSELQLDDTINKPLLYRTAANWHKDNGNILRAIVLAAKSGDIPLMENYLRLRVEEYGKYAADIEGYVSAIMDVHARIPGSIARQSLRLSLDYFAALFCFGRLKESLEWLDTAKELLAIRAYTPTEKAGAMHYFTIDPREDALALPASFKDILALLPAGQTAKKTSTYSLTMNLPFLHKAVIDKTSASPQLDIFLSRSAEYMLPVLGPRFKPIILLYEGGILYERGELANAEKVAAEAVQISEGFPPEIQFSSMVLYNEILRVQGKAFDMSRIGSMINESKAYYLSVNFDAYVCETQLLNGDARAASTWLAQADIESTLKLYKIYQYFTTARALIVTGRLSEAEKLLERLAVFSRDYRRSSDIIKAHTLRAICKWHMKRTDEAVKIITSAIVKAAELQLVMPVVNEGCDIMPVLQKILNRLRYGYDADILDKAFVNNLFLKSRILSQYSRGMFVNSKNKPVKLSPRQLEILEYLSQNLSYYEISVKSGVKVTTVHDHIRKLYEKLGVSSAHDAVIKASELGIGNMG